jgi:hypothetical protein
MRKLYIDIFRYIKVIATFALEIRTKNYHSEWY